MAHPTIREINIHHHPHVDELVALMLIMDTPEGRKRYPGAKDAAVNFWRFGQVLEAPKGDDILNLGFDRGDLDEHEKFDGEQYKICCASLVAREIGLRTPAFYYMLRAIVREDRDGGARALDEVPRLVKLLYQNEVPFPMVRKWASLVYQAELADIKEEIGLKRKVQELPDRPLLTIDRGFQLIKKHISKKDAVWWSKLAGKAIKGQRLRFQAAKSLLNTKKATWENIWHYGDRYVKLVVVYSDNPEVSKAARSKGAGIVVRVMSTGNIQIMTSHRLKIDLTSIAQAIRFEEMLGRELINPMDDEDSARYQYSELSIPGTMEDCPWWHLHDTPGFKGSLYNGTETSPDVPRTILKVSRIVHLIKTIGRGEKFHHDFNKEWCRNGRCAGRKCPWFHYHLGKCHKLRLGARPENSLGKADADWDKLSMAS